MVNPLITYAINKLNIPETVDIYKIIITYGDGKITPNATLYLEMDSDEDFFTFEEKTNPMNVDFAIDIENMCNLIKNFSGYDLTIGTDRKSIYTKKDHRLIKYIRFVIPDGLFQIDFEDEQTAEDTTDYMYNFLRSTFTKIHNVST